MDCIIALPGQLFRSTQIPACLWFLSRARRNGEHRDRQSETLFIDARKLGHMTDRTLTGTCPRRTSPASPTPTTPGGMARAWANMPTSPASARERPWTKFASTVTSSPPAAT